MITQSSSISCSLEDLLATTIESYRQGCKQPIVLKAKTSGDYSEKLLNLQLESLIRRRLSLPDQLIFNWSTDVRFQGLDAARRGQFVTAEQLFAKARKPLELGKLSPEGSLLYKSFQEPAEAYLDYRRGDFEKARSRIFNALVSEAVLEQEFGYKLLFIHSLHLVKHLVRIEASSQCFNRALEIAAQLLGYLKGSLDVLPILGVSDREPLMRQSSEIITIIFIQFANEVALILAGEKRQIAKELFANISQQMQLQINDNSSDYSQLEDWFIVKWLFLNNHIELFLKRAAKFLIQNRGENPLLWYATVIDLIALCGDINLPASNLLKLEVAQEAVNYQNMPKKFLSILGIELMPEIV